MASTPTPTYRNATPDPANPADWRNTLLWPALLRAGKLALRPARIGIALFAIVLIGLIGRLPELWLPAEVPAPLETYTQHAASGVELIATGVARFELLAIVDGVVSITARGPAAAFATTPWSSIAILLPIAAIWTLAGLAVSRSAALEFSLDRRMPWTRALAFGVQYLISGMGALLGPVLILALLLAVIALLGLPLGWGFTQVIAAILFALSLIIGFAAALIVVGYVAGQPLLLPGVACEGADAFDSIQRTYAYTYGRPLRLVLYLLVIIVQMVVLAFIVYLIANLTRTIAWDAARITLSDDTAARLLAGATTDNINDQAAGEILAFLLSVPRLIAAAILVSFYFTGSTLLYLMLRLVNDGQEPSELWTPESVPGTTIPLDPDATGGGEDL